jgi:hypothetical protein
MVPARTKSSSSRFADISTISREQRPKRLPAQLENSNVQKPRPHPPPKSNGPSHQTYFAESCESVIDISRFIMSRKSSPPSPTGSQDLGKVCEEILNPGTVHPTIEIQPLSERLSQDGVQRGLVRRIVTEEEAREYTAYAYKRSSKWRILAALWMVSFAVS